MKNYPELARCIEVIQKLRHPTEGCPWDLEQTHESLLKYLIEESYEFIEACENKDPKHMEEELGDVLLQILLHSTIAAETKSFDLESVAKTLADKIVYRHPHVFGEEKVADSKEVLERWQKLKKIDKAESYIMNEKLIHLPALESANKIGEKSATVNFDWENANQVLYKVEEEWQELKEELYAGKINQERVAEEMGDLLFSVAQLARHLQLNPESTLRAANKKFLRRFQKVEDYVRKSGKTFQEHTSGELEEIWSQVKKQ